MHLQSICKYMVNSVDIQYKNSKNKRQLIIKSSDSSKKFWTAEKLKQFVL